MFTTKPLFVEGMNLRRLLHSFRLLPCIHSRSLVEKILAEGDFIAKNIGDPSRVRELYSVYEMADVAVSYVRRTYGIEISDPNDKFVLHKELVQFHSLPQGRQDEVLAGCPSNFKAIPRLLKELKKIEKKYLMRLNDEEKEALKSGLFLHYIISAKPLAKMIRDNLADKGVANLSREERKKITEAKRDRLMKLWSGGKQIAHEM